MITSSETQDFVPFGRDYIRRHPGQFQVKGTNGEQPNMDLAAPLTKSFKDITLHEPITKESWVFHGHSDPALAFDEELYVQGPTVVWSKGGQDGIRTVVKTFTMDAPVQQALWGTFVLAAGDHSLDCRSTVGSTGKEQQGICVVTSDAVSFFIESGGEYLTSLPFQVSHTWKIKNGLLFERTLTHAERTAQKKNCPSQTVIFSLLHPLDDVAPVITRVSSPKAPPKVSHLTDSNMAIIFTSCNPSIVLSYDTMVGLHSVWKIRRARQEELDQLGPAWDANASFLHNMTPLHGNNNGTGNNCSNHPSNLSSSFSSRQISGMSSMFPPGGPYSSTSSSPLRGFSGKVMSPSGILRCSPGVGGMPPMPTASPGAAGFMRSSPGISASRAQQSPSTSAGALASVSAPALYRFHTPSPTHQQAPASRCSPGRLMCSPGPAHHSGLWGGPNESLYGPDPALSIQPNVCLEHIWTETAPPVRDGPLGKASKAFLTEDLCGQQFLCFLVPYKQHLRCLKFEESNDGSQLIFGSVTYLHAKDATPIESQQMLLVLEMSGILVLYSGIVRMSQVHIPVLPLGSGSTSVLRSATTPMGSPTRGGEVFTSSRPPSAMDARFDEQKCKPPSRRRRHRDTLSCPFARPSTTRRTNQMTHISPVSANLEDSTGPLSSPLGPGGLVGGAGGMVTPGNSFIQNLRDNVGRKFSVELLNGSLFRTELPVMTSSPGIDLCLRSLKYLLPKDIALQLMGRWYTTRNSPGASGSISEWAMFSTCLLSLMGYDTAKLGLTAKDKQDGSSSPLMQSKRARPSEKGTDEDWGCLLSSKHHQYSLSTLRGLHLLSPPASGFEGPGSGRGDLDNSMDDQMYHRFSRPCAINTSAPLFPFCPAILLALHMAYEEMKLNILLQEDTVPFAPLLLQIACDLRCESYADYYKRDFPHLFGKVDDLSQISAEDLRKMQYPQIFPSACPTVQGWIHHVLSSPSPPPALPYIPGVCDMMSKIITLYAIMVSKEQHPEHIIERCLKKIAPAGHRAPTAELSISINTTSRCVSPTSGYSQTQKLVLSMIELGMTQRTVDSLPMGIGLPLREALLMCRPQPPMDWHAAPYWLIGRQDMATLASLTPATPSFRPPQSAPKETPKEDVERDDDDGMDHLDEEVLRLRFPRDLRIKEVKKLLQSSRPVPITIKQLPEVSDHYFMEKQEKVLLSLCIRTMALPVGRGIFTLHTCQPLLTETLHIPKLCLTGRAPPRNTTVDLNRVDAPANMSVWPKFHNGVAAGLRIADTTQVDSAWIIYNRPKELNNEFAGFLMALGLNGHLPNLSTFNIHEYISEGSELVIIGILLGMSAAKRGSMDQAVTKVLSVHVSPLLPPTSMELNISHNTRVAAVMGVGLLYQGTGHMHMAEVMLMEIGRPPGPEMENCVDRQSYSLSAGLALGLIMFGRGNQTTGLSDLSMADLLCHLMVGGHSTQMLWSNRDRVYRAPSFLIKEGDQVNVDVTSPGATMALGMIFFDTDNSAVSEWLKAPDTQFMLDQVRPDFLCLRTISYGLVNWQAVLPSISWVNSNIPQIVQKYAFYQPQEDDEDLDPSIDLQTMSQAHSNITSGACLVMAFKFAGSGNANAFQAILESFGHSMKMLGEQKVVEQAGRSTLENAVTIKLLALAIVMAGTGNLVTLKICRAMRRRVGPQHQLVHYGHHMCISMATGLIFMGGGKLTMKTTPEAIGAMLCAFYPHLPVSSTDNKYHLQAFRHFYVMACEPRLIIPRDVDTGKFCFVPLRIKFKGCPSYKVTTFTADAPYIIPELSKLEEIQIIGTRYWPILFRDYLNWDKLKILLAKGGVLPVKQRAGNLSYFEDPKGYRSALAKSLVADHSCHFSSQLNVIKSFTSDSKITALTEGFIIPQENLDNKILQELNAVIYQCVTQEKGEAICPYFVLKQMCRQVGAACSKTWSLQQLKLVQVYYNSPHRLIMLGPNGELVGCGSPGWDRLLHREFLISLRFRVEKLLSSWVEANTDTILSYLRGQPISEEQSTFLAQAAIWFSLPSKSDMISAGLTECPSIPALASIFPCLNMAGLVRLQKILKAAE